MDGVCLFDQNTARNSTGLLTSNLYGSERSVVGERLGVSEELKYTGQRLLTAHVGTTHLVVDEQSVSNRDNKPIINNQKFICQYGVMHWAQMLVSAWHLHSTTSDNCSCSRAVRHRQGGRAAYRPRDFDLQPKAIHSSGLPFNGPHPRNPCKYMDYYSFTDRDGMEGWVGMHGWPIDQA